MGKNFKQNIQDMESGLNQLNNIISTTKERHKYEKARKAKEIQIERISFFKKGYNLAMNEIKSQRLIK